MMQGKKSSKEKKRKHSRHEFGGGGRKRRSTESSLEDPKEELEPKAEEVEETVQYQSEVEEGGLDLNLVLKPISAYLQDRQQMLEQCFHVIGDNKLHKMLPDELKDCSLAEIKALCWDQLQQLSQGNLLQILEGKELTASPEAEENKAKSDSLESQQDNNVDSTSSVKETAEADDKQAIDLPVKALCVLDSFYAGGSGEESDVLSINADVDDSDIEGHKEDSTPENEAPNATSATIITPSAEPEPKLDILQSDIDKSVSEILALTASPSQKVDEEAKEEEEPEPPVKPVATTAPATMPSAQQLALLELEMRARAIKALMKANELKK